MLEGVGLAVGMGVAVAIGTDVAVGVAVGAASTVTGALDVAAEVVAVNVWVPGAVCDGSVHESENLPCEFVTNVATMLPSKSRDPVSRLPRLDPVTERLVPGDAD